MAREFAKSFYKSTEWQQVRRSVLMRDGYLCVRCKRPAKEVHHKIHLTPENIYDIKVSLNPNNLETLCRECHFDEHRADKARGIREAHGIADVLPEYEFDANGFLVVKAPS